MGDVVDADRRRLRAVDFVPVEAKFHPSVRQQPLVPRGPLVDRLMDAGDVPVVLVFAPIGYGKSVLVSQWSDADPRPFAWLTVDERDDDAAVFVTYLLLALHRVEAVDPTILSSLARAGRRVTGAVLDQVGDMLRRRQQPFVLVLDGIDALTSRTVLEVFHLVAENLPNGSQLCLIGRRQPAARWRDEEAQRRVLRLGQEDLRFSNAEVAALIQTAGARGSGTDIEDLLRKTEGWAAGLSMTALALPAADEAADVDTAVGSESLVADYLREELLANLATADQRFLERVSVLDEMCGAVCDTALQTQGSAEVLQRLATAGVLLVPLAEEGWYRLHHVFAALLRVELRRSEPELVRPLQARASRWFEAHDRPEEAIAQALNAGEADRAASLIWHQVPACLASGRLAALEDWLSGFTPRQVTTYAELALTAAWCALQRGRVADHWLSMAEAGRYAAKVKERPAEVAAACALLRSMLGRNGAVQMGADADLARRLLPADDPWSATVEALAAVSACLSGHPDEGRIGLERVVELATGTAAHDVRALALPQLAVLALDDDDMASARTLADEAARGMRAHGLEGFAMLLAAPCLSALIRAGAGGHADAHPLAQSCAQRLALAGPTAPWAGVQCRRLLAQAELALGHPAAARTVLSEAQTLLSSLPDGRVLRESVARTWRQIETLPTQGVPGALELTSAELRVLQYLPTHLSFEEIGRQLFVSRNTVKTQAVAAYRKLGVASRSEAVERAYALGLITSDAEHR